jgi:hypothetical protein
MAKKISDLTADASPTSDDLIETTNDPGGTPASRKVTLANLFAAFQTWLFGADAGSTDSYAVTLSPAPSAYVTGQAYRFKANTVNTGAATVDFNGLGAKTIKKAQGGITTDLDTNDIRAGQWVDVVYDGTNMQMQSTLGNAPSSGAPTGATYITQTADGTLSAEQALGALATGVLKSTTSTGVVSIATVDDISAPVFAADAGANDTYSATLSPAISSYVTGTHYRFKANTANTGACTINFNGIGAKTIKKVGGGITTDLADNDIRANQWVELVYDGTNMQMVSQLGNAASASPGGSDKYVQFNDGGALGGDVDLQWDKTTNTLSLANGGSATPVITVTSDGLIKVATLLAMLGSGSQGALQCGKDATVQWTDSSSYAAGTVRVQLAKNATAGFLNLTGGSFNTVGWLLTEGTSRCTSDFAKTTNTTLANITGVTQALKVDGSGGYSNGGISGVYSFEFECNVDADATGGYKFAVNYSSTVSAIAYTVQVIKEGTPATLDVVSRQTTLGGAAGSAGATAARVRISGTVAVSGSGNLTVQFAQNVSNGTSTVISNGSFFNVLPILR